MMPAGENNRSGDGVTPDQTEVPGRNLAFDYLRAFVVTLVLCHHAILAYTTFAFINFENPIATFSPVVNEQRWIGFDLIVAFNETFFMPLLFFISGLFVWQSLARKEIRKYLRDRLIRLGLPFVIGVFFLIPLAYYPAQLQIGRIAGKDAGYGAFWIEMIQSGFGTAGPLWFLWLLLTFNCLVGLLYRAAPFLGSLIRRRSAVIFGRLFDFILIGPRKFNAWISILNVNIMSRYVLILYIKTSCYNFISPLFFRRIQPTVMFGGILMERTSLDFRDSPRMGAPH